MELIADVYADMAAQLAANIAAYRALANDPSATRAERILAAEFVAELELLR